MRLEKLRRVPFSRFEVSGFGARPQGVSAPLGPLMLAPPTVAPWALKASRNRPESALISTYRGCRANRAAACRQRLRLSAGVEFAGIRPRPSSGGHRRRQFRPGAGEAGSPELQEVVGGGEETPLGPAGR
jgi:hypothetical protein